MIDSTAKNNFETSEMFIKEGSKNLEYRVVIYMEEQDQGLRPLLALYITF